MPEPIWKPSDTARRLSPYELYLTGLERREEEIKVQANEICPFAGKQAFPGEDLVRYCMTSTHGPTCGVFRVKPFEACPAFPRPLETKTTEEGCHSMRVCPNCGYKDHPFWRHVPGRLYTDYVHISELETFESALAMALKTQRDIKRDGYIYHLTKSGHVNRLHESDSKDGSWAEPPREKYRGRMGPGSNQTLCDAKGRSTW